MNYDVIVIGAGPGGEGAAMRCAKGGKSVIVIDENVDVGGACTHTATIPSKALRYILSTLKSVSTNPLLASFNARAEVNFPDLMKAAEKIIGKQVALRQGFYDRNNVDVLRGRAEFIDENTIEVSDSAGVKRYTAEYFVIATGSRPFRPAGIDFSHANIFDSDKLLQLDHTPRSISIYGAGVIGCEYASIFRNLECKVNLINTRHKLLDFLDDEIVDALAYHLRDQGVLIRRNEKFEKVEGTNDGVVLYLASGKQIKSDIFLWANGRSGNSDKMNLQAIGLEPDNRGNIKVNDNYQTDKKHIFAVGDITGFPNLASAAYDQGRYAASVILEEKYDYGVSHNFPTGIYTSPEISSIGPTEQQLTEQKVPYEVGHAIFRSLARAQIVGSRAGMLKILFHRETLEVLAVHCFGYQASEIIHIGQAIMSQKNGGNTIRYFIETTFNYPTMAEAYRVAALYGLNRAN